jgi:hypothetical protein
MCRFHQFLNRLASDFQRLQGSMVKVSSLSYRILSNVENNLNYTDHNGSNNMEHLASAILYGLCLWNGYP